MKFSHRLVRRNGGVELRFSLLFSEEEAKAIPRIADDPNVGFDKLRVEGDLWQQVDHYLTYLRILAYWAGIWENRDKHSDLIMRSIRRREAQASRRKRKRRNR